MTAPALPPLGGDTVAFVTVTLSGAPDAMGQQTSTPASTDVPGCRHRALSVSETPAELTDIATQVWQTHAPPSAAPLAISSTGRLTCNGVTYQMIGNPEIFTDADGQPLFVKILSKREQG